MHCMLDIRKKNHLPAQFRKADDFKDFQHRAATDKILLWLSYALRKSRSFCYLLLITAFKPLWDLPEVCELLESAC